MTITASLPPSPPLDDGRPAHKTRTFSIAEVRWASVALLLFTIGLALQLSPMPEWTYWAAYLACYLAVGGSRQSKACGRFGTRPSTSTC